MTTLKDRMTLALTASTRKQVELAAACGVKPASVNNWLSGATKSMKSATAMRAAAFLGVNQLWLTEGKGLMRAGDPADRMVPAEEPQEPPQNVITVDVVQHALIGVLASFGLGLDDLIEERTARERIENALHHPRPHEEIVRARFLVAAEAGLPASRATRHSQRKRYLAEIPPDVQEEEAAPKDRTQERRA